MVNVQLTPSAPPDRLIYEDPHVRIAIGYDDFVAYLDAQVEAEEIPGLRERRLEENAEWQQEVDAALQARRVYYLTYPQHKYFIAHMLETGRAEVQDDEGSLVTHIYVHTYAFTCGALCGTGHRYFYLPNPTMDFLPDFLFFEVRDWIS